ncbi:WEB family protein At1g12150-like [Quercus lobata]|uniref:WEB family protein n=1 Tax=Quercus lobata TaxID=97700 RepID=A0A7N2R5D5_QUELO|nr:WEB family protein At1g12150-like [Quercus lobata]
MVNIRMKDRQKVPLDSSRKEVGEIDTRAPFQSVKAAVSLFGEVAVSRDKSAVKKSKLSSENVLDKETQLLLAQNELNEIKQHLVKTQCAKTRALTELEKAKRTVQDLTTKLKSVNESKQSAIEAAEAVKNKSKNLEVEKSRNAIGCEAWKQELDYARKEYTTIVTELDSAKQELNKIRQDFDAALEAKLAAFQQGAEAKRSVNINTKKARELSKEIAAMQSSIQLLKHATPHAQQEHSKIVAEKDACIESFKSAKREVEKKVLSLKKEVNPESDRNLEAKFAETSAEIEVLQEEMKKAHASEMDSVRVVTSELNKSTKTLQKLAEEESSLRKSVSSLRLELEDVKKEQAELKEKEVAEESLAAKLNTEVQNSKAVAELKLQQLLSEAENAEREAEEMKRNANELRQEAEATTIASEEAEKILELALREAEEAKAAEKRALDEMRILSEKKNTLHSLNSDSAPTIKLSLKRFDSLSRKAQESINLAEKQELAAMAQLEAINASKNEADRKLEANLKEIDEMKTATKIALTKAEMAESAKTMVEGELRRWRQQEKIGSSEASSSFKEDSGRLSGSTPLLL